MALGALLAVQDAGLEAGLETLKSLLSISSFLMEDTQLTTGAQPPEVFCSSDNTSGCVVLPILPYEAEVGWPSQCCVQSMCWNRNVSGFKMLRQVLAAGKAFASPSLFYCRDRQEERGPHWPR